MWTDIMFLTNLEFYDHVPTDNFCLIRSMLPEIASTYQSLI